MPYSKYQKAQKSRQRANAIKPNKPNKKPDIDNIVKIILDAMNGIAFKDDTQITKLNVEKHIQSKKKYK